VNAGGTLAVTKVGGPLMPTLDGEYCRVLTRGGKLYSGTILSQAPAAHVFPEAATMARDESHMEVRLDEKVTNAEEVRALGIENGDYVFIDPKFTVTPSGFLKSRFIDDKASAVVLLMLLRWCAENRVPFLHPTRIYFAVYEEVGHGASALAEDVDEFVTVDMGCVGLDLAGSEYAVSICAKDSGGPYDYELTGRLIQLAKDNGVNHTVDIFPFYGSDVGAALRSGRDVKGALIGTGVCASHGMERTHLEGIEATLQLLYLYLCKGKGE
jgi:putative aminopeptidase FrvX